MKEKIINFISIHIKDDPLGDLEQMFAVPVTTISSPVS